MIPEALIFPISHFLKDLSHSAMVKDMWVKKLGILDVIILLPREDEQGKEDGGRGVAPREAPVLPNLLSKLSFAFFDFLAS